MVNRLASNLVILNHAHRVARLSGQDWLSFTCQQTDLLLLPPFRRDLARIQEWCSHWCIILNPNKTMVLVVGRSWIASPPHVDLVFSGIFIRASPNLDTLCMKFGSKFTFEDQVLGIVSVSFKELVF